MTDKFILRGSKWSKWDLHVHTHASYDWDSGCKDRAEEIVKKAIAENISVIAITDHHTVAGIDEIVKAAKGKDITILPGVELRTDKGNKGIHIIGIFNSSVTSKTIHDKLLCPLNFSENDVKTKGNEQIYCAFETACQKIHELGGIVLLHAGNKSNGIEQLDSDIRSTLKKDLAFLVDIFEVSALKQVEDYRKIVFPKIKQEFPCIITSDACDRSKFQYKTGHSTEAIGKKYSWIKADPTFDGLKQIIYEPVIRVCLDESPPLYLHPQIVSAKLNFSSSEGVERF
jgi:predicted metal-dependent phosphoesterase TrpH